MTEEPISEYDEGKIPEQKAKDILESPEDNEDYFPNPYRYFFKDKKIDRDIFDDLKQEVKNPELLIKKLKTQEELEEEIMQDSFVYQNEWDFFLEDLSEIMKTKNQDGYWETPCNEDSDTYLVNNVSGCEVTNKKTGDGSRVCTVNTGIGLIEAVIDFKRFQYGTGPIRIFEYKKAGLKIKASQHDEIFLLPACRSGFIRDWDKDGVCVSSEEAE
jgi:hypothetical protein